VKYRGCAHCGDEARRWWGGRISGVLARRKTRSDFLGRCALIAVVNRATVFTCAESNYRESNMVANRRTLISLSLALLWMFWAGSLTLAGDAGWSRVEAEAKLSTRVQCISNPDGELLQWGPNFPGWDRSRQPKAVGRPVKVGTQGVIKEVLEIAEGQYRVVVHWDPEKERDPYWSTVIGPAEVNVTTASLHPSALVGRWREVGRAATIEFLQDGGFKAVDNEGMAVAGRFTLVRDGNVTFEIQHEGTADEIITLNFSLIGDELTLTPSGRREVECYRREN